MLLDLDHKYLMHAVKCAAGKDFLQEIQLNNDEYCILRALAPVKQEMSLLSSSNEDIPKLMNNDEVCVLLL